MVLQAEEEAEQLKWVYVRVKRAKATYFLHVDLQQTAFEVKAMLQLLTQRVRCHACVACIFWRLPLWKPSAERHRRKRIGPR